MDGPLARLRTALGLDRDERAARSRALRARYRRPLLCRHMGSGRVSTTVIGGEPSPWTPFFLVITERELVVAPYPAPDDAALAFPTGSLRWFGRPRPYSATHNPLWLHVEHGGCWTLVQMSLGMNEAASVVRRLKSIASPELSAAYRRRRPYIHHGPTRARSAAQDLYGAWTLTDPVDLYVMPLALVLLDGQAVRRALPLASIRRVEGIARLDGPGGVVALDAAGERLAFACDEYRAVATALAQAARRTLAEPLALLGAKQKRKPDAPL